MSSRDSDDSASGRPSRYPWPPILFVATLAAAWILQRFVPLSWPGVDDAAARVHLADRARELVALGDPVLQQVREAAVPLA